jgi:hypothetical protein
MQNDAIKSQGNAFTAGFSRNDGTPCEPDRKPKHEVYADLIAARTTRNKKALPHSR